MTPVCVGSSLEASPHEGECSYERRRGAAVVFGHEGFQAFDFWSAALYILKRPWYRSGAWREGSRAIGFRSTMHIPRANPEVSAAVVFSAKEVSRF